MANPNRPPLIAGLGQGSNDGGEETARQGWSRNRSALPLGNPFHPPVRPIRTYFFSWGARLAKCSATGLLPALATFRLTWRISALMRLPRTLWRLRLPG